MWDLREVSHIRTYTTRETSTHPATYQKNRDSLPACLNQRATYSAVPPKSATVTAYGRPTPSARMWVGNISAFTTALIEVYPVTKHRADSIRKNAPTGLSVPDSRVRIGTVSSVPPTPKNISSARRPIRSDSAPAIGCRQMKTSRARKLIQETVSF